MKKLLILLTDLLIRIHIVGGDGCWAPMVCDGTPDWRKITPCNQELQTEAMKGLYNPELQKMTYQTAAMSNQLKKMWELLELRIDETKTPETAIKDKVETTTHNIGTSAVISETTSVQETLEQATQTTDRSMETTSVQETLEQATQITVRSMETGIKGTHGVKGGIGEKGDQGQIGSKGSIGIDGATGSRGDNGNTGVTETQGIRGEKGEIGDNGTDRLKGDKRSKVDVETFRNLTTKIDKLQKLIEGMGGLEVRLMGGEWNTGRVEVFYKGEWGTVCDDDWDMNDGHVVCRMLGFTGASAIYSNAHYGQGIGIDIVLDDVECTGSETNIAACLRSGWKMHDCNHSEDASVDCSL